MKIVARTISNVKRRRVLWLRSAGLPNQDHWRRSCIKERRRLLEELRLACAEALQPAHDVEVMYYDQKSGKDDRQYDCICPCLVIHET